MPWTLVQRQRLAVEKDILDGYFPGKVEWIDPTENTKVEVTMTTNSDQVYCLRLYIRPDFPNSLPILVVRSSPNPMPNWPATHATHTLGQTKEGHLIICHYLKDRWNPEHTFYEVFVKGRLWLEAYEGHLATRKPMAHYLGHMK